MINNIQELQIGSYVSTGKAIVKIEGLSAKNGNIVICAKNKNASLNAHLYSESFRDFKGIEITADLLNKMGFEEVCSNTIQNRPELAYSEEIYGFSMYVGDFHITSLEAPYIHLLQKLSMKPLVIGGDV